MIKTVLFDAGGVLHYSHDTVVDEMRAEFNLTDQQLNELFSVYEPLIGTGKMTEHQMWSELQKKWGIREVSDSEKIFTQHFEKKLQKIPGIYELADSLKSNGLQVGIFSNVSREYAALLQARGHYEPFDIKILSYEAGFWKPDPAFYIYTLESYDLVPEETIFIDDRINNVLAAEALGIHGIEFKNAQQVRDEIDQILIAN